VELAATVSEVSGHDAEFIMWNMSLTEAYQYQRVWLSHLDFKHKIKVRLKGPAPQEVLL
jgi:hypothetical protein